jgi:hypothetical protein
MGLFAANVECLSLDNITIEGQAGEKLILLDVDVVL